VRRGGREGVVLGMIDKRRRRREEEGTGYLVLLLKLTLILY